MRSLLLHLPNSLCLRLVAGGRALVNDMVSVLGSDFNVSPDYETVRFLESMGYKRDAEDWLDYETVLVCVPFHTRKHNNS
jgi:hypothetical protein